MNRSLLRIHAHAWFVIGFCTLAFFSLLYLKTFEIYHELEIENPKITDKYKRWFVALQDLPGRRLDNPSLWALIAVAFSAWLCSRAAAQISDSMGLPQHIWTRRPNAWLWLIGMTAISLTAYLIKVNRLHETFWYDHNPNNHAYLNTPNLFIQIIEGSLNLISIAIACTLVPVIRSLMIISGSTNRIHQQAKGGIVIARARLATAALGPFSLMVSGFFIYKTIKFLADHYHHKQITLVHSTLDITLGIAGALFVTLPLILCSWELLLRPATNEIKCKAFTSLGIAAWLGTCCWNRDIISPPPCFIEEEKLPQHFQLAAHIVKLVGFATGVMLWFVPKSPVTTPPPPRSVRPA